MHVSFGRQPKRPRSSTGTPNLIGSQSDLYLFNTAYTVEILMELDSVDVCGGSGLSAVSQWTIEWIKSSLAAIGGKPNKGAPKTDKVLQNPHRGFDPAVASVILKKSWKSQGLLFTQAPFPIARVTSDCGETAICDKVPCLLAARVRIGWNFSHEEAKR